MESNGTRISKLVDNEWNRTEKGYLNQPIINGIKGKRRIFPANNKWTKNEAM